MVELLLKHRSPLNPADIAGQTPLHHAVAEGHGGSWPSLCFAGISDSSTGDTAVALLKAGAETDKKDVDGSLAMDLAPDAQASCFTCIKSARINFFQVRKFILQSAEREGIEL
jgi:26S proteasome non-ATPase regulatory subunit 10